MSTRQAADLHDEVRRLRLRITSLAAAGAGSGLDAPVTDPAPAQPHDAGTLTRRQAVRAALAELAALAWHAEHTAPEAPARSPGAAPEAPAGEAIPTVPDLGDRVLADQLVVLLLDCAPEYGASPATTAAALRVAVALRRRLA